MGARECQTVRNAQRTLNVIVDIAKGEIHSFAMVNAKEREREVRGHGVIGWDVLVQAVSMGRKSARNVFTVINDLEAVHVRIMAIATITRAVLKRHSGVSVLLLVVTENVNFFFKFRCSYFTFVQLQLVPYMNYIVKTN